MGKVKVLLERLLNKIFQKTMFYFVTEDNEQDKPKKKTQSGAEKKELVWMNLQKKITSRHFEACIARSPLDQTVFRLAPCCSGSYELVTTSSLATTPPLPLQLHFHSSALKKKKVAACQQRKKERSNHPSIHTSIHTSQQASKQTRLFRILNELCCWVAFVICVYSVLSLFLLPFPALPFFPCIFSVIPSLSNYSSRLKKKTKREEKGSSSARGETLK